MLFYFPVLRFPRYFTIIKNLICVILTISNSNAKPGVLFLLLFICSVVSNSCDPMNCSPPGSSVHEISQARVLEWAGISFFRDLPDPEIEPESLHWQAILYH